MTEQVKSGTQDMGAESQHHFGQAEVCGTAIQESLLRENR